jgi:hypothetical protein
MQIDHDNRDLVDKLSKIMTPKVVDFRATTTYTTGIRLDRNQTPVIDAYNPAAGQLKSLNIGARRREMAKISAENTALVNKLLVPKATNEINRKVLSASYRQAQEYGKRSRVVKYDPQKPRTAQGSRTPFSGRKRGGIGGRPNSTVPSRMAPLSPADAPGGVEEFDRGTMPRRPATSMGLGGDQEDGNQGGTATPEPVQARPGTRGRQTRTSDQPTRGVRKPAAPAAKTSPRSGARDKKNGAGGAASDAKERPVAIGAKQAPEQAPDAPPEPKDPQPPPDGGENTRTQAQILFWAATIWQSKFRMMKARRRIHNAYVEKTNTSGVMHAMYGTKPGATGWYQANESVYFFKVTDDGQWEKLKGPLTETEYRHEKVRATIVAPDAIKIRTSQKISGVAFLLNATVMKDSSLLVKAHHHTGKVLSTQINPDVCNKNKADGEQRPLKLLPAAELRQFCTGMFRRLELDGAKDLSSSLVLKQ